MVFCPPQIALAFVLYYQQFKERLSVRKRMHAAAAIRCGMFMCVSSYMHMSVFMRDEIWVLHQMQEINLYACSNIQTGVHKDFRQRPLTMAIG